MEHFSFIDGQLILSNDGVHPLTAMTALAQLDPGPHQLTLLYFKKEGGRPALKLQWEGGPYKFRRQTFKFNVDWAKLRVTKAVPTCKTQPPAANPEGVPLIYGLDQCHITCKDCLRGSQAATACSTCKPKYKFLTILDPQTRTGSCTSSICPLCKPKECCDSDHPHYLYDERSGSGMCLKPTDKCSPHCVELSPRQLCNIPGQGSKKCNKICTVGCNQLKKLLTPSLHLPAVRDHQGALFDIVISQGLKTVQCSSPLGGGSEICSSGKLITPKAVCPQLDEFAVSVVYRSGGTCALDAINKLVCERNAATRKCVQTLGGSFVGCQQIDKLPLTCPLSTDSYTIQSLHCMCEKWPTVDNNQQPPARCQSAELQTRRLGASQTTRGGGSGSGSKNPEPTSKPWSPLEVHQAACHEVGRTL